MLAQTIRDATNSAEEAQKASFRASKLASDSERAVMLQVATQAAQAAQIAAYEALQLSALSQNDAEIYAKIQSAVEAFTNAANKAFETASVCEKCIEKSVQAKP